MVVLEKVAGRLLQSVEGLSIAEAGSGRELLKPAADVSELVLSLEQDGLTATMLADWWLLNS